MVCGVLLAMKMLSNAAFDELVSRYISFLFSKLDKETTAVTAREDLQRLRHLLLRALSGSGRGGGGTGTPQRRGL